MNRLLKLEKLAAEQAFWAAEKSRLKQLGAYAYARCEGADTADDGFGGIYEIGGKCIENIAGEFKRFQQEPYNYISFEEFYADAVADDRVCPQCQLTRKYKSERMNAQRKLGYVRSAITRIGKSINSQKGEQQ
jgi:hypothetical protein